MSHTIQSEIRPASREAFCVPLWSLGYDPNEVKSVESDHYGVTVTRFAVRPDGERWTTTPEGEDVAYTETVFHPFDDMQDDALSDEA